MAPNGEMMRFSARQQILLQKHLYFSVDVKCAEVLFGHLFPAISIFFENKEF